MTLKPLAPPNSSLPDYEPRKWETMDWVELAIEITRDYVKQMEESSGLGLPSDSSPEAPPTDPEAPGGAGKASG